jgi:hypothetical protein
MDSDMNIHCYILTYDESRMIRHTINWYSGFCEKIIIYDNESPDDTVQLAKWFPNVEVKTFSTDGLFHEGKMTKIRNECWKESRDADYVIVCDADEFLYSKNIVQDLIELKRMGVAIPLTEGNNMVSGKFPDDYSMSITEQVKTGVRAYNFDKRIIFDPKAVRSMNFGLGSHKFAPDFYKTQTINVINAPILKLLHYKWLDKEYISERHKQMVGRMSKFSRDNACGWEYEKGDAFINEAFTLLKQAAKEVI